MFNRLDTWLLIAIFLPAVGAALVGMLASRGKAAVRQSALVTTLITLAVVALLISRYPGLQGSPAHVAPQSFAGLEFNWLGESSPIDIKFSIGLDGLSLWLFGLSALLSVTSVLVSWEAIDDRPAGFYALLLLLETGMLGVFAARDIILFYVFFEFTLIPLFFLIGIWGSEDRRYAAMKFFLFTLAGSLLTFLGLLSIVLWHQSATGVLTFSIQRLTEGLVLNPIPNDPDNHHFQMWIFLALFAGFAIKVPLFPLHTWLPLAHVQAPTAGSVILAGILLKIGTYGFARFNFPMLPEATAAATPWLLWLSAIGIIYGALVALAQSDIKRLIAYSSVSHLGYCMLGMFALNRLGMQGGVLQMINHGLSTGGLFALVGMIYERWHTRQISELGGLARRTPILAFFMVLFTLSSIGMPGMNGFAGEFLLLAGMFQFAWLESPSAYAGQMLIIAVLAVFGVVLGAWYMLWLVQRTFFGPLREPHVHGHGPTAGQAHQTIGHGHQAPGHGHGAGGQEDLESGVRDMSLREVLALAPLVVFVFWIGLQPGFFLEPIAPTVNPIAQRVASELQQQQYADVGQPRVEQVASAETESVEITTIASPQFPIPNSKSQISSAP